MDKISSIIIQAANTKIKPAIVQNIIDLALVIIAGFPVEPIYINPPKTINSIATTTAIPVTKSMIFFNIRKKWQIVHSSSYGGVFLPQGIRPPKIGGREREETLMLAEQLPVPPEPETVRLYVIDDVGDTIALPEISVAPKLEESIVSALLDVHVKVDESPEFMELGEAERLQLGGLLDTQSQLATFFAYCLELPVWMPYTPS